MLFITTLFITNNVELESELDNVISIKVHKLRANQYKHYYILFLS
jgi:hypothetical protein